MKEPGAEELRSRRLMLTRPTRGDVGAILVIHQDELASEAASLVVSWAAIHQGAYRVIARVRPANVGSHRVALNAGLIRAPNLDGPGLDGSDHIYTSKPDR